MDGLADHIRLGAFSLVFAVCVLGEALLPRRSLLVPRRQRWLGNLSLFAADLLLLRLMLPLLPISVAAWATQQGLGLMPMLGVPSWLAVIVGFLALDLLVWGQHRLLHAQTPLWKLHRVHHGDRDLDVTTGLRFHPAEIALSTLLKVAAVCVLGVPPIGVLAFEAALNGASLFTHANLSLGRRLDGLLRLVFVTPDVHRLHHSVECDEMNSNFGTILVWWDRMAGTYIPQPRAAHRDMRLGLADGAACGGPFALLSDPWQ